MFIRMKNRAMLAAFNMFKENLRLHRVLERVAKKIQNRTLARGFFRWDEPVNVVVCVWTSSVRDIQTSILDSFGLA